MILKCRRIYPAIEARSRLIMGCCLSSMGKAVVRKPRMDNEEILLLARTHERREKESQKATEMRPERTGANKNTKSKARKQAEGSSEEDTSEHTGIHHEQGIHTKEKIVDAKEARVLTYPKNQCQRSTPLAKGVRTQAPPKPK